MDEVNQDVTEFNEPLIPQRRVNEVLAKTKAIELEIAEFKANQEAEQHRRESELSEIREETERLQTESERLMTQKAESLARINELEDVLSNVARDSLERVPADLCELVPTGEPAETIEFIYKAESMGVITKPVDTSKVPVGKRTNGGKSFIREITNNLVGTVEQISMAYGSKGKY